MCGKFKNDNLSTATIKQWIVIIYCYARNYSPTANLIDYRAFTKNILTWKRCLEPFVLYVSVVVYRRYKSVRLLLLFSGHSYRWYSTPEVVTCVYFGLLGIRFPCTTSCYYCFTPLLAALPVNLALIYNSRTCDYMKILGVRRRNH